MPNTTVASTESNDGHGDNNKNKQMKVTLLSGFLGAGKTTLLKRILRLNNELKDEEKLNMAVIVNDMGEINLDAEEIKNSKVVQEDAEMVEMTNGCICCTLRGDLLKTVKSLSEEGKFDYLVIESTGIGEPLPVAQTFAMDVDQMEEKQPQQHGHKHRDQTDNQEENKKLTVATDAKNSLFHYAKLDTLVTVVDSINIYDVLTSIETLADKDNISGMEGNTGTDLDVAANYPGGKEAMETQKAAARAAANNLPEERLRQALTSKGVEATGDKSQLVTRLIETFEKEIFSGYRDDRKISKLFLDQIEFANVIIVSKAKQFLEKNNGDTNKLKQIEEMLSGLNKEAKIIIPSEDKYGDLDVSETLINTGLFDMEEAQSSVGWAQELEKEGHNPETLEYGISSTTYIAKDMPFHPARLQTAFGQLFSTQTLKALGIAKDAFQGVVRTKGQLWLANAHAFPVYFQTAGSEIEMQPGDAPFLMERKALPKLWTKDVQQVYEWFQEEGLWTEKWGDRRSQLVFIGVDLDADAIHNSLNKALLTEAESAELGGIKGWKKLKDPFFNGDLGKKCDAFYAHAAVEKAKAEEKKEEK